MDKSLIYPAFTYVIYILAILIVNFLVRKKAIVSGQISPKFFKTYDGAELPSRIKVLGRHLDNQFQLPVLFIVTCLGLTAMNDINSFTVTVAWLFVVTRLVHSYIHLTRNHILHRAYVYATGWFCTVALWVHLVFFH